MGITLCGTAEDFTTEEFQTTEEKVKGEKSDRVEIKISWVVKTCPNI